jgi:hypothetical protein
LGRCAATAVMMLLLLLMLIASRVDVEQNDSYLHPSGLASLKMGFGKTKRKIQENRNQG